MRKLFFPPYLFLLLLGNGTISHAQDTYDASNQFGARSALMGGAVAGGLKDQPHHSAPSRALLVASGSNPNWSVRFEPENILLILGKDSVWLPSTAPDIAQDVAVQRYHIQTESGEMIMHLIPGGCPSGTTQQTHQVTLRYKRGIDKKFTEYKGCGTLYPDPRLNDIYVVQQLGTSVLDRNRKLPVLEFHLRDNRLLGSTGCNNLNASLKVDGPILHVGMPRTTRKACTGTYEKELLQALTPGAYYYHFTDGLLVLERKNKATIYLKKTD